MERCVHNCMLEAMPPGVCLTDDTGFIIYTNPAAHAMLGYKPGELIARRTNAVHSFPEEGTLPSATSSKCVGEAIWAGELPSRRKDGTTIASQVWGARVDVPGKLYWIFVQDGVSAKK